MIRKKLLSGIALLCLGAALAGCGGTPASVESQTDASETAAGESKEKADEAKESEQVTDDAKTDAVASKEDETEMSGEVEVKNVTQELVLADPMTLMTPYERAAYFADWAYLQKKENTMISPLSLNVALGLAAEGASGETAKQLHAYLGREDYTEYVSQYMGFAEGLAAEKGSVSYNDQYSFRFEIANSLWIDQKKQIQEAYRKSVEESFRAEVAPVDFEGDVPGTVKKVNDWCNEKTHGMIPEIISERNIKPNMRAILVNSLYFESPWLKKWNLWDGDFTDLTGNKTTREMLIGGADAYYENDKATAFGKYYYNGFQFIGILPKAEGEFSILDLDLESLLQSQDTDCQVRARMPKLNFDTTAERVEDLLKSQGVTVPFEDSAQLDKIIQGEALYVDSILQKCKIELDENGTKAAAVTAMMLRTNSIEVQPKEIKEVYLDRPFAFLIYDSQNDEILFVGKVTK